MQEWEEKIVVQTQMYKMRYGLFEGLFYEEMHRHKKKKKNTGKKKSIKLLEVLRVLCNCSEMAMRCKINKSLNCNS